MSNPAGASASTRGVLWIVSEVFGHQENSTGALLEQLVSGLRAQHRIEIAMASPADSRARPATPSVSRQMVRSAIVAARLGWTILRRAGRHDVVIALTNPPLLPTVLATVRLLKRFQLIVLVHDVYPEALYAVQPARRLFPAIFDRLNSWALRRASRVIVIGRDMQRLLQAKLRTAPDHVVLIPNWSDIGETAASAARESHATNTQAPLVVQYSGKMGVTHNPVLLAQAASILQQRGSTVRLDVYSWGAKLAALRAAIRELGLSNIVLHEPCPRELLPQQLASGDVGLILMSPGMAGVSVPCRLYNLLALGKPVIAAVDAQSEIGLVVAEANIGWVADPSDPVALADAICAAEQSRSQLGEMGVRALGLAHGDYSFAQALNRYQRVIDECVARA